jgi:hypothetical protein
VDTIEPVSRRLELLEEFRRRFPLFDRTVGYFGGETTRERVPWFFGFILSAASNASPGACCFVLEKTPGTTAIAAVLAALVRLQVQFPALVEQYARTAFARGQRVQVKPSNFVYEYDGIFEGYPGFFRLKIIGEKAWRSLPLVDVLRLEPTERVRPKGAGNSNIGVFVRSPLDLLLDLTTCGNNSIIRNAVLVHMPRSQFVRVAEAVILAPTSVQKFAPLSLFLPWGSVAHDGSLTPNDSYQVVGQPLLACTSVPEDLALACASEKRGTKIVLVDGARRLVRDLQAFDDIAGRQKLLILASPEEGGELELLKERGCRIWHMSAKEMLLGESSVDGRRRSSLVGASIRAAELRHRCKVITVDCRNEQLEAAATSLENAAGMIGGERETPELDEELGRLFGLLFECSECCFGTGSSITENIAAARGGIARHFRWLRPDAAGKLRDAIDRLEQAARSQAQEKMEALVQILTKAQGEWAVVARSPRAADLLKSQLDALGVNVPVLPITTMGPDHEYDGIVVPAWPNEQRFTRLKNLANTPEIRVLVYPFERKWVVRHQQRERMRRRLDRLEANERSSILGMDAALLSDLDGEIEVDPGEKELSRELPVFKLEERIASRRIAQPPMAAEGEDRREARLVRFFGGCYALLTEWAELPVLNDLFEKNAGDEAKLVARTASDLSPGDFVLFRAGGDKEFTRLIAEELLGAEEYKRVRDFAELWKDPLRRLGDGPTMVKRRLEDFGLERNVVTIAGWLGNQIPVYRKRHASEKLDTEKKIETYLRYTVRI